ARAAEAAGAEMLVMDDGFQNPSLEKDLSLLVVDGGYGFGNGRVMPAGPLREPLADALSRVDAVAMVGADTAGVVASLGGAKPIHHAHLEPLPGTERLAGRKLLAFAGIGRPGKFFDTLEKLGAVLVDRVGFPDHHRFSEMEVMALVERAHALDATPITTEKDAVRLPPDARRMVEVLPVALVWRDPVPVTAWLERVLAR
ncbi:MAG: tetraacyldisaccharide 4'-kinase, partial [Alphaproteobacteria bacterium]|nr:tetraacyldisaccharide 4'-kinase [Alphaproteobacteria bacterium]